MYNIRWHEVKLQPAADTPSIRIQRYVQAVLPTDSKGQNSTLPRYSSKVPVCRFSHCFRLDVQLRIHYNRVIIKFLKTSSTCHCTDFFAKYLAMCVTHSGLFFVFFLRHPAYRLTRKLPSVDDRGQSDRVVMNARPL